MSFSEIPVQSMGHFIGFLAKMTDFDENMTQNQWFSPFFVSFQGPWMGDLPSGARRRVSENLPSLALEIGQKIGNFALF